MVGCPSGDQWGIFKRFYWNHLCSIILSVTWAVGSSAPSASLLITPRCMLQLMCWREAIPSMGTLTGLRGGSMGPSWSSTRPSEIYTCSREIPHISKNWEINGLRATLARSIEDTGGWRVGHEAGMYVCSPERQLCPGCIKKRWHSDQGRWFFLCILLRKTPTEILHPTLDPPTWKTWTPWSGSRGDHENEQRAGIPLLGRQVIELGVFNLEKRRLWEDLVVAFQFLKRLRGKLERDLLPGHVVTGQVGKALCWKTVGLYQIKEEVLYCEGG